MTVVGYTRSSTAVPGDSAAQLEALRSAGAEHVFADRGELKRGVVLAQWAACLDRLRPGDELVVWALDRVASTEQTAVAVIVELAGRGVRVRSVTEPVLDTDTSTPTGETVLGVLTVLAQLRVSMLSERTKLGLERARAGGRVGGRPIVMTPERIAAAVALREQNHTIEQIAGVLGVGSSSVSRALSRTQPDSTF